MLYAPGVIRAPWPLRFGGKAAGLVIAHRTGLTHTPMEYIDMEAISKSTSAEARPQGINQSTEDRLRGCGYIFSDLAGLAESLEGLGLLMTEALGSIDEPDVDAAVVHSDVVRRLASMVGALADHGAILAGTVGSRRDMAAWLLPPVVREDGAGKRAST